MCWRPGTMLKRFFEAKSFRFHVPKLIQVPTIIIFEYFDWKIMYICCVCIICMYYMYVKLRGQVALQGQQSMEKHKLRIQGRMQIFEKMSQMALNRVLTLPDCRSRCQLLGSVFRSQKGPLGAELWSFYCRKRISVPMSYITFLD